LVGGGGGLGVRTQGCGHERTWQAWRIGRRSGNGCSRRRRGKSRSKGKGRGKGRGKRRKRRRKEGRAVGSRAVGRRKTIRYGGHWSSSQRVWTMSTIVSMIVIVIVMAIMLLLLRTRTMGQQQQGQPHCRTVVGGGDDSES